MTPLFASLLAIMLVIALGWALRAYGVLGPSHWDGVERLTYQVLFPALIIHTLAMAELRDVPVLGMGGALAGAILVVSGLLLVARPHLRRFGIDGPAFTSILQGAVRWNSFVAVALAASLHGRAGATLIAIAVAAMIPLLNVVCVLALARFAAGTPLTVSATLRSLATNPFIWSSAIGVTLNQAQAFVPVPVAAAADIVGRASLGIGLLAVGAALDLRRLARPRPAHLLAVVLKLVFMPVVAWALGRSFGVADAALSVTVIAAAVPTATAAYILARRMGGDAALMAEITTVQTLLSMVTLPLAIALLR